MYMNRNGGALSKAALGTVSAAAKSAGTVNGTAIDRKPVGSPGFDSCKLIQNTGVTSGTPTSFTVTSTIQDSADGSTGWANYTPPNGSAALVADTASAIKEVNVDLSSAKRYIRVAEVTAFVGGTAPTVLTSAVVVLTGSDEMPTV